MDMTTTAQPGAERHTADLAQTDGALEGERADMNCALAAMCALVAQMYRKPVDENLADYFRTVDLDDPDDVFLCNEACRRGLELIKRHFSHNGAEPSDAAQAAETVQVADVAQTLHDASADFHRLFVGPMKLVAAPWSSVYLDLGSLFGPTALAVERVFKENGFAIPEGNHEPFDHIGYELAFIEEMHKAAERAREQETDPLPYLDRASAFVKTYVLRWMDAFLGKLSSGARTDCYRGLAELTRGLLEMEATFLGIGSGATV